MAELQLNYELRNAIAAAVAKGLSLSQVAKSIKGIPDAKWIQTKLDTNKQFKAQIDLIRSLLDSIVQPVIDKAYHAEVGIKIAERVARGDSFKTIAQLSGYPTAATMRKWVASSEEFSSMIWDARREAAQQMADELVSIADNMAIDPASRRIMVDTRKFIAKSLIVQYNDKMTLAGDKDSPLELMLSDISGKTLGPPVKR